MFGVFSGKSAAAVLLAMGCVVTGVFVLLGVAGRTLHMSASVRELPVYSVDTGGERLLSLGINCAWDDSDIDKIIALLDVRDVKATFFIVGNWCDKYPDAVRRLADAGHELGSHSDTHPDMTTLSREQIVAQLDHSKEKIEAAGGKPIRLFRPPSGAYNNLVVSSARACGWEAVQWSNDSLDWKNLSVDEIVARVVKKASPGDITLFHAGKPNTAAALERVIDTLTADGYHFLPVGELLRPAPYTLDHTGRQCTSHKRRLLTPPRRIETPLFLCPHVTR